MLTVGDRLPEFDLEELDFFEVARVRAHAEQLGIAVLEFRVRLPNSAISVGQTKVKSMGQERARPTCQVGSDGSGA